MSVSLLAGCGGDDSSSKKSDSSKADSSSVANSASDASDGDSTADDSPADDSQTDAPTGSILGEKKEPSADEPDVDPASHTFPDLSETAFTFVDGTYIDDETVVDELYEAVSEGDYTVSLSRTAEDGSFFGFYMTTDSTNYFFQFTTNAGKYAVLTTPTDVYFVDEDNAKYYPYPDGALADFSQDIPLDAILNSGAKYQFSGTLDANGYEYDYEYYTLDGSDFYVVAKSDTIYGLIEKNEQTGKYEYNQITIENYTYDRLLEIPSYYEQMTEDEAVKWSEKVMAVIMQ